MAFYENVYPVDWPEISARVKQLARYKCEQCGKDFAENTDGSLGLLDVHHIDGDKSNNSHANLVALCRPCHTLIERVFVVWESFMGVETEVSPEVSMWFKQVFPWAGKRGYWLSIGNKIYHHSTQLSPAQRFLAALYGKPEYELPELSEDRQAELNARLQATLEQLKTHEARVIILRYGLFGNKPMSSNEISSLLGRRAGPIRAKALRKLRHPIRSRHLYRFACADDTADLLS
jgi:hypothetical protein